MSPQRRGASGTTGDVSPVTALLERSRRWSDDDWWRLEAAAWRRSRRVVVALAGGAPHRLWAVLLEPHARSPLLGILSLLGSIAVIVGVLFGVALASGWVFWGADLANVGLAGIVFALVAAFMAWQTWQGRHAAVRDPGLFRITGLLLAVPSAFALFGALAAGPAGIEVEGAAGAVGIAASVAVGVWSMVVGFRRPLPTSRADRIGREIERVGVEDRQAATSEIATAVDVLASRGLITTEQQAAATSAGPGMLGLTLGTPRVEQPKG